MHEYAAYEPAAPYFDLVRRALGALVDGEHFFDIVADDVVYEVLYELPGWPRVIKGRTDLMAAFRGYVENIALQSAHKLIAHKTDDGHLVIEYEVHGTILATGREVQQPVLLDHQRQKPEDYGLERLPRFRTECMDLTLDDNWREAHGFGESGDTPPSDHRDTITYGGSPATRNPLVESAKEPAMRTRPRWWVQ